MIATPLSLVRLGFTASLLLALFAVSPATAEPAMWVVHGKNGSTVYLLGTVHVLRAEAVWKSQKIEKAFEESQELWLEVADFDDATAAVPLFHKYGLDPSATLSSKLDPVYRQKLAAAAQEFGLPLAALDRMKPWLATTMLTVAPLKRAGYGVNSGVEAVLKSEATKRKEPVNGFESMEHQISMLAKMPESVQMARLEFILDNIDRAPEILTQIERYWEAGDALRMGSILNNSLRAQLPVYYDELVVRRNKEFARRIEDRLAHTGVAFVAVGAAHLAGPDSVQAQLAKDGVQTNRF